MIEHNEIFVGIDPGKSGAIAVIDANGFVLKVEATPMIGTEYDKHKMAEILNDLGCRYRLKHVALEDVHAIQGNAGGTSNFEFGRGKGLWEMALCALGLKHTLIQPKEWQKHAWEGVKKQTLPTARKKADGSVVEKVDAKATSLIAVKRLFPAQNLLATPRSKVPHDGMVDALLIAEVCRRKFM